MTVDGGYISSVDCKTFKHSLSCKRKLGNKLFNTVQAQQKNSKKGNFVFF